MNILKTGNDGKCPKPKKQQAAVMDMWGHWTLYEEVWHDLFPDIIDKFVEQRKHQSSHFNKNYIRYVEVSK